MLGSAWLMINVLLFILAIALKQPALLMVAMLFFFTSGLARLWSAYSLKRLDLRLRVSEKRAFWGENVNLEIALTNGKFLPLPWIHLETEVPQKVTFLKGKTRSYHKFGRDVLSGFFSLSRYHRLKRRYPIQCSQRGLFFFGPAKIDSGDPFGFFRSSAEYQEQVSLLVYPRILTLQELGIPSRQLFGDIRLRRHLFTDPVQVMSIRDYQPGDPLKHINWKATARASKLQTRVFDYTTTMDLALFVDTRSVAYEYYWVVNSDLLETVVLTAAAIAADSLQSGYKVGVYANEYYWNSDRLMKLPPSDHPDQMKTILEALTQIRGLPALTIDKLISREARQISWESTLVLVTAVLTDENAAVLQQFHKAGRRIALVLIGEEFPAVNLPGITVYRVSEEVYRKQAAELALEKVG